MEVVHADFLINPILAVTITYETVIIRLTYLLDFKIIINNVNVFFVTANLHLHNIIYYNKRLSGVAIFESQSPTLFFTALFTVFYTL